MSRFYCTTLTCNRERKNNGGEKKKRTVDLVTVLDAILTSRQTREELQCLYENLISNNFRRTAVLKKISFVNQSFTPEDSTERI